MQWQHVLTTIPEGIFQDLTALEMTSSVDFVRTRYNGDT